MVAVAVVVGVAAAEHGISQEAMVVIKGQDSRCSIQYLMFSLLHKATSLSMVVGSMGTVTKLFFKQ